MYKKVFILIFMWLTFTDSLWGITIIVDQSGNGDYTNITDAINSSSNNDTIYVRVGIYNEQFGISKEITLYAEDVENTILTQTQGCITVSASNVVIQGFKIMNCGFGIYITGNVMNVEIKNNLIIDCGNGIDINNQAKALITSNIIENNGKGVWCGSGSTTTIINNLIHSNAIGLYMEAAVYLYNNIIVHNNEFGIKRISGVENTLYNNVWSNTVNYLAFSSGLGDISSDPNFYDYENNDFRLRSDSPCIDAGYPSAEYYDPDGTRNDMGIYGGLHSWSGLGPIITNLLVISNSVKQGETISVSATATIK